MENQTERLLEQLELTRPLVVLDLETTGTWIAKDRIIEIGMVRLEPDGKREVYNQRVNPGIPIPPEVTEVTGICDTDVAQSPPFKKIAQEVLSFLDGADLGGFNLERFDLPVLARELNDLGLPFDWSARQVFDAQKVYHLHEKRDLSAAYAFYCEKDLINAHSALADSEATLAVLAAQVRKYGGGNRSIDALKPFEYEQRQDFYDKDRRFRWWNGELYMMFGKYARSLSLKEVAERDRGYLDWIMSQNFSDEVKELVGAALEGHFLNYADWHKSSGR